MSAPLPLTLVDPDSPQADELRQLLNIVSGRAPDSQGRTSEPLVKEELAIVEFLTAKTNYSKAASDDKPSKGDDQTPVDLLLGLAKTRSGKRAAEEEKRQIRLQQLREAEEQSIQKRNGGMSSPWGYVAPSMPGLDVHQPFGQSQRGRAPKPLQPPPSKKPQDTWSSDIFNSLNNEIAPFASPQRNDRSPLRNSYTSSQPPQNPFQPQPPSQSFNAPPNQPFNVNPFASLPNLSPNQDMSGDIFGQNPQFGQAQLNNFDFADLGLNIENVIQSANTNNIDWQNFNPFALQQTAQTDG